MTHPPTGSTLKKRRQGAHRQMKSIMDRVLTAGRQEGHCHLARHRLGHLKGHLKLEIFKSSTSQWNIYGIFQSMDIFQWDKLIYPLAI